MGQYKLPIFVAISYLPPFGGGGEGENVTIYKDENAAAQLRLLSLWIPAGTLPEGGRGTEGEHK